MLCDHWNSLNRDLHRCCVILLFKTVNIYIDYCIVISKVCCISASHAENVTLPVCQNYKIMYFLVCCQAGTDTLNHVICSICGLIEVNFPIISLFFKNTLFCIIYGKT
jgi:hypothetical protein